tara:strand:+ start:150 stop:341 length:192 start_codon:yes stop_codon:yes gene_type:complete
MVGSIGNHLQNTKMLNEDDQRELHKQLRERIKQLRMDKLFEEPCSLYDDLDDDEEPNYFGDFI